MNKTENNLSKLSKEELIQIIDSYKDKLASLEEYMSAMKFDTMRGF